MSLIKKLLTLDFDLNGLLPNIKQEIRIRRQCREIINSGLFDKVYYLKLNPEVDRAGFDPVRHYVLHGFQEGRNPSGSFNTQFYSEAYPEVGISGLNPLLHYLRYGKAEGRLTMPRDVILTDVMEAGQYSTSYSEKDELALQGQIRIIRESRFFDESYYVKFNQDVREKGADPLDHFCRVGWKEMRNPGPDFDVQYYLSSNPDINQMGVNPLWHYLIYGHKENRLTKEVKIDEKELINKADFGDIENINIDGIKMKVAVVCHLYYLDLVDEFLGYFRSFNIPFDLYITTSKENEDILKEVFTSNLKNSKVQVFSYGNTGRDIGPFIELLKTQLDKYQFVCKVHSKKSIHNVNLRNWRSFLIGNLIGNASIINRILFEFHHDKKLGIVFPVIHPYLVKIKLDKGWGKNSTETAKKYFAGIDFEKYKDDFGFPAGSMFWFRPSSLDLLKDSSISINDFGEIGSRTDSTLAHTIERLFGILPVEDGYHMKKVYFPQSIRTISIKPDNWLKGSKTILFISHDLFQAGAEMILLNIVRWFKKYTAFNVHVLSVRYGGDGGKLLDKFKEVSSVFIWEELLKTLNEEESVSYLKEKIGRIDLIYGNTIQSPRLYPFLADEGLPVITHIHELEESIKKYTSQQAMDKMKKYTSLFIPCSGPVKDNLNKNHQIPDDKMHLVYEFIEPSEGKIIDSSILRKGIGLNEENVNVWGCGAIYWRKGVDIFIETAKRLRESGVDNFHFYWIGGNYWTEDTGKYGDWYVWEKYITNNHLDPYITFLGEKDNPKHFYQSGDIFYLPSREDPFPLVCLEAAECELPIVCFNEAGGMPSFVKEDAGSVIPFVDIKAAAREVEYLIRNEEVRNKKGMTAREKLLKNHITDITVPGILNLCHREMKGNPLITVIVPVYNQAGFIKERVESILNQTFRDFEIIIIDDCSTDESHEIASGYEYHPAVRILKNDKNTGSVFKQWQKGVELARGKFLWIAEGDDVADPALLETLLPAFNDPGVNLSYCASHGMDKDGNIRHEHYIKTGHYNGLSFQMDRWLDDYTENGLDEIKNALSVRNTIPNASAVLMRTASVGQINFEKCIDFRCAGDWFAYVSILNEGKIHYSAKHLNYHRLHAESVVGTSKSVIEHTVPDYFKMHKFIIEKYSLQKNTISKMTSSVTQGLRNLWPQCNDEEFTYFYDHNFLLELYERKSN